jgi:hypothetical protein
MMAWLVMISIQCRINAVRIKMLVSVTMPFKNQSLDDKASLHKNGRYLNSILQLAVKIDTNKTGYCKVTYSA